jgi:hypothetical protein
MLKNFRGLIPPVLSGKRQSHLRKGEAQDMPNKMKKYVNNCLQNDVLSTFFQKYLLYFKP